MKKVIGEGEKFERIRRVTGYLSGDVSHFNNAKREEEAAREKHSGIKEVIVKENNGKRVEDCDCVTHSGIKEVMAEKNNNKKVEDSEKHSGGKEVCVDEN